MKKPPELTDEQIKINNSKIIVRQCFDIIKQHEQEADNAYTMLTLITNCVMNLELNNLADVDMVAGAVNIGMQSAMKERAERKINAPVVPQKFII